MTPDDVLTFWFGEPAQDPAALKTKLAKWFRGGPTLDAEIHAKFGDDVLAALDGKRDAWLEHPKGWLALLVVLDQFTRNVFRGDLRTHAGDTRAAELALAGLDSGKTQALSLEERHFALMPLLHSENLAQQARYGEEIRQLVVAAPEALRFFYALGIEQSDKYIDIVRRFGRFPHRNALLGRTSTPEEEAFLVDWDKKRSPSGAAAL
jgi:uncharacterized protein (DUF924 family)